MDVPLTLLLMLLCLMLEAFFSGSEIGVVSADQIRLRHEAAKGSRGARLALEMLKKPEWLLSTTLVGTNLAVVTNTTLATAMVIELLGPEASWLAVVLVAPLIWVFGEIVPKSVFQDRADAITPRVIFGLKFASYLFAPVLFVFSGISRLLAKWLGGRTRNPFTLREEIITMLQMPARQGDIQPVENDMIRRLFNFSESTVADVMLPLIGVVAVPLDMTRGEVMAVANRHNHVRLPVYDGRVDSVVGFVHAIDLLGLDPDGPVAPHVQPVRYVPGAKGIRDLLLELRASRETFAVVVDEYGGAEGLVTMEDIMEEVVEDLQDEYDDAEQPAQWIRRLDERDYLVSGRTRLDAVNEQLDLSLPDGDYTTLAGLVLARAGNVPPVGTVIEVAGVALAVRRATRQAVEEVRLRW